MFIRRFAQLFFGLCLYGFAGALMVRAGLGLSPWNVFHQGVANHTHLSLGLVVCLTGGALMLAWIPLRQRIGIGTVTNVVVIGLAVDLSLARLPLVHSLWLQLALLAAGIVLTAVATGIYIGAGLEPGPRDGLMTGLVRRTGWSVRVTRTSIELVVLGVGIALGGDFGVGTVVYALCMGPLVQIFLPLFASPRRTGAGPIPETGGMPRAASAGLHERAVGEAEMSRAPAGIEAEAVAPTSAS